MQFTIRDRVYTVVVWPEPLLIDGQQCRAKIDRQRARIFISDQIPRDERRVALLHELRHAWITEHGRAMDDESDADQSAEMMDHIMAEYELQGGDGALLAMRPERVNVRPNLSGPFYANEFHCGDCGSRVAIGSVASDPPAYDSRVGDWIVARGFLCPSCERVTVWREACAADGLPLGAYLIHPPPRVIRGEEEAEWISAHAKSCRVFTG